MELKKYIADVPDFPQEGIMFRDITPLLQSPEAFRYVTDEFARIYQDEGIDVVVPIEARGFVFGGPLAYKLGVPLIPVRKPGKLPRKSIGVEYDLEYGSAGAEIHEDGLEQGQRALIVDDLLATGGTAAAAVQLVEQAGGTVTGLAFLIELEALNGRQQLKSYPCLSLIKY